jgi:signal transduction histidine kinase
MPLLSSVSRRRPRPPLTLGVLVALACLVAETGLGALLQKISPVHALAAPYLIGLVFVTSFWGLWLGLAMALVSTVLFDYFLIPPAWSLTLTRPLDLTILGIFLGIAVLACPLARLARLLSAEVQAREDADLCAELARVLLRAPALGTALPIAATKLARVLGLPSASIRQSAVTASDGHAVFPLHGQGVRATLVVPARIGRPAMRRLQDRVVPALEVLLEAAHERERVSDALRSSCDQLAQVVEEQTALRRLATLVAHAAPPTEIFEAVAREMGQVLDVLHTVVARYDRDGTAVAVGSWNRRSELDAALPVTSRWTLEKGTASEVVWRTWAPARIDSYGGGGRLAALLRERGIVASVACPVVVGCSLWGLVIASASVTDPLPPDTDKRLMKFTELIAAAIANAQSDADLRASRARVVAAADEARRRIERDLHDGTQQRLVSIGLELRQVASAMPSDRDELGRELAGVAKALDEAVIDLQELSRGLHPAALAKGGLKPGLSVLARRCALPVELEVSFSCRFAQQVEVTAYYIVSEALTNAVKHASASAVRVRLDLHRKLLRVSVCDDGGGGADPSRGSGLLGLTDRVEALGGTLSIASPPGRGTSLLAELPFEATG